MFLYRKLFPGLSQQKVSKDGSPSGRYLLINLTLTCSRCIKASKSDGSFLRKNQGKMLCHRIIDHTYPSYYTISYLTFCRISMVDFEVESISYPQSICSDLTYVSVTLKVEKKLNNCSLGMYHQESDFTMILKMPGHT